jgi:hypothetical protein
MSGTQKKLVSFRLPVALIEALKSQASQEGVSMTELVSRFSIAGLRGILNEQPQHALDDAEPESIAASLESLMAQSTLQLEHLNHQSPNSDKADMMELLTIHLKVIDKMMSKAS